LVGDDPDIAHNAATTAIPARATGVVMDTVALDTHAKLHLGKFHRVVLLRHVVDRVRTVSKRPRAKTDTEPLDAQRVVAALAVQAAEHVDDVDGRGSIGLAIGGQGQSPEDTVIHPQHGVRSHAKWGRGNRIDQTTRPCYDLVYGPGKAMIQQDGGIAGSEIETVHKLGVAMMHDEVDRPTSLVVSPREIQTDSSVLFHEGQVHRVTLVGNTVAIQIIAKAVRTIRHTRLKRLTHRRRTLLDDLLKRCQSRVRAKARENILEALLAQPTGSEDCTQVALENIGETRIARKNAEHLVV